MNLFFLFTFENVKPKGPMSWLILIKKDFAYLYNK